MAAVRGYIVQQTREVTVRAESPTAAIALAAEPLSSTDQDNRDNHNPVPIETEITARASF